MATLDSEDEDEAEDSLHPRRRSSSLPASTSNGTVGLKRKTMAMLGSEDENEPEDTHHPRRESPQLDTVHPRRESPQSKPVTGTINAPSSSSFAKPSNSNKGKRIVTMLDSDDDDDDETFSPKRRPPRDKTTSQPTLSQRAIPIAAATTTQRTDKLVLQDWKPEANQEGHEQPDAKELTPSISELPEPALFELIDEVVSDDLSL